MWDKSKIKNCRDWIFWCQQERPSIAQQLNMWLGLVQVPDSKNWNRCEMDESGIKVLMRCETQGVENNCLVIATVSLPIEIQRKGWFKSFLAHCCEINPWNQIVIEDVGNPVLRQFLEELKCPVLNDFYTTTYIVNQDAVRALNANNLGTYSDYISLPDIN